MSSEIVQIKHAVKDKEDLEMVSSADIFPSTFSPIPTNLLKINMQEEFSILKFQASTIQALRSTNTALTARVWRRLTKFLEWEEQHVSDEFSNQVQYEILLVMSKVNRLELYNCRMDGSLVSPERYYNDLLSDLIARMMLPRIFIDIASIEGLVEEFKKFLKNEVIILSLRLSLGQVFTEFKQDENENSLSMWICKNIDNMRFISAHVIEPFYGVTLRCGILLMPIQPLTTYFDWSKQEQAAILTLVSHQTAHYLARKYVDDFDLSSPYTKTESGSAVPRNDINIDGKFLGLGRAMELQLFDCQPDWYSVANLEEAGAAFIERVYTYSTLPLFSKSDLSLFNISERQHPSVSFGGLGAELLQEKVPLPFLD